MATPSFASTIKTFALQQETNQWLILEFSALGFIGKGVLYVLYWARLQSDSQIPFQFFFLTRLTGKLFRSSDLSMVVEFFLMFHKDKPVDWLMDHILWVKVCNPEKDQVSSYLLFYY